MLEVISGLPREELFSASQQRLHDTAVGVLAIIGQRAVRVFLRPDPYRRFLSCLVYLPRDRYTTSTRLTMAAILQRTLGGTSVDYTASVSESRLALVHFTVHTETDAVGFGDVDVDALQDELSEAVRTWDDRLLATEGADPLAISSALPGIPVEYKAIAEPARAVADLTNIAQLTEPGAFEVRLYPGPNGEDRRFTFYLAGEPATCRPCCPCFSNWAPRCSTSVPPN